MRHNAEKSLGGRLLLAARSNGVALISRQLGTGEQLGYRFAVAAGKEPCKGTLATAVPILYGSSGVGSYFADGSGVIRGANLPGRPAGADAPTVP